MRTVKDLLDSPIRLSRDEIDEAVSDPVWQEFRRHLLGTTTEWKLERLDAWIEMNAGTRTCYVQVQNYLNALKRGGLL